MAAYSMIPVSWPWHSDHVRATLAAPTDIPLDMHGRNDSAPFARMPGGPVPTRSPIQDRAMKLFRRHPSDTDVRAAGNCTTCNATGQVALGAPLHFAFITCPACDGTGRGH